MSHSLATSSAILEIDNVSNSECFPFPLCSTHGRFSCMLLRHVWADQSEQTGYLGVLKTERELNIMRKCMCCFKHQNMLTYPRLLQWKKADLYMHRNYGVEVELGAFECQRVVIKASLRHGLAIKSTGRIPGEPISWESHVSVKNEKSTQ